MKSVNLLLITIFLFFTLGCSLTKNQKKGSVFPEEFDYETEFTTLKTILIIPAKINEVTKNFLFDTGADLNVIQRDSTFGKISEVSGASNRKMKMGEENVPSIKIGDVEFKNTFAQNGNLVGLKEQIPNFGGILGQPAISKANWLIDYLNKKIRISNQNLVDNSFKTIRIKRERGAPYTYISINGTEYKVIVDLGSSSEFSLPKESKLAKQLLLKYKFEDNERERWTIGGSQIIKEKVGVIPLVKLGDIEFKDVSTKINVQSQPRIGVGFFKDCIIYIDNLEGNYKIKK